MIYDWKYGGGPDNTTNYVHDVNVIAQASVLAGQSAGIIQFELDKGPASPLFPIIQQLYGQWAYQPQFSSLARHSDGTVLLSGRNGGPNIGYTLVTADEATTPLALWTPITNTAFDSNGSFSDTDWSAPGHASRFYRVSVP
jgi:hypothetical protein